MKPVIAVMKYHYVVIEREYGSAGTKVGKKLSGISGCDGIDRLMQNYNRMAERTDELMRNAGIDRLKEKGRVGIINACLRLKMVTDNQVKFALESEKGVGMIV